jgi:hypothetical protein
MDRSGKKEEKRDKIPLSQKTLLDNGEKIVWVMGAARGLAGWGRTRRVLCSSSTQFFFFEKNSPVVPEFGSWCHLGPRTLNSVFLGP